MQACCSSFPFHSHWSPRQKLPGDFSFLFKPDTNSMSQCPEWQRLQAQKQIFPFLVVPNPLYTSPPTPEPSLSSTVPTLQASHLSQSNYRIIDWRAINNPSLFTVPPSPSFNLQSDWQEQKKALGVTHLIPLGFLYSLQINRGTGTKGLFLPAVSCPLFPALSGCMSPGPGPPQQRLSCLLQTCIEKLLVLALWWDVLSDICWIW